MGAVPKNSSRWGCDAFPQAGRWRRAVPGSGDRGFAHWKARSSRGLCSAGGDRCTNPRSNRVASVQSPAARPLRVQSCTETVPNRAGPGTEIGEKCARPRSRATKKRTRPAGGPLPRARIRVRGRQIPCSGSSPACSQPTRCRCLCTVSVTRQCRDTQATSCRVDVALRVVYENPKRLPAARRSLPLRYHCVR